MSTDKPDQGYFQGAKDEIAQRGGRPMAIAVTLGVAAIAVSVLLRMAGPALASYFPLWAALWVAVILAVALATRCTGARQGKLTLIGAVAGGIVTGVLALLLAFMAIYMGTFNTKVDFSKGFESASSLIAGAIMVFVPFGAWGGALAMWVWDEPEAPKTGSTGS